MSTKGFEDWKNAYGGLAIGDLNAGQINQDGILQIVFSRPVHFPTDLVLEEYNNEYVEDLPQIELSEEEMAEIEQLYQDVLDSQANGNEDGSTTIQVQVTREVCE